MNQGKLTLGKPSKKIQPGAKPTAKPNPETKPQGGEAVDPKESVTPAKVEGEGQFDEGKRPVHCGGLAV